MRPEVEGRLPIDGVNETVLRTALLKLRSYDPSSFASLTDADGTDLQVAGGGVTCMIERRDGATQRHERAFQDKRSAAFPDGTALVFGGGSIKLKSDEWFTSKDVAELFVCFLRRTPLPERFKWRDVSEMLTEARMRLRCRLTDKVVLAVESGHPLANEAQYGTLLELDPEKPVRGGGAWPTSSGNSR